MIKTPELPPFKPEVKIRLMTKKDVYPKQLPYVEGDRFYLYVGTSELSYLDNPEKRKAWIEGKEENPKTWWLAYIHTGYHSNFKKIVALCDKEIPDAVEALYHPVWQYRIIKGLPVKELVEEAKDQWEYYWSLRFSSPSTNYLC